MSSRTSPHSVVPAGPLVAAGPYAAPQAGPTAVPAPGRPVDFDLLAGLQRLLSAAAVDCAREPAQRLRTVIAHELRDLARSTDAGVARLHQIDPQSHRTALISQFPADADPRLPLLLPGPGQLPVAPAVLEREGAKFRAATGSVTTPYDMLTAPVVVDGRLVALLTLWWPHGSSDQWTPQAIGAVEAIAEVLAGAGRRIRDAARVQRISAVLDKMVEREVKLVDSMDNGVLVLGSTGAVENVNSAFYWLFDLGSGAFDNGVPSLLSSFQLQTPEGEPAALIPRSSTGRPLAVVGRLLVLRREDGDRFLEVTTGPIPSNSTSSAALAVFVADVTEGVEASRVKK